MGGASVREKTREMDHFEDVTFGVMRGGGIFFYGEC